MGKRVPKPKGRQKALTTFTHKKRAEFLALIAMGWAVQYAAQRVGISKVTAYSLQKKDKAFAEAWLEANRDKVEHLEQECFQRAVGRDEIVIGKGGEPQMVKKYSDLLLIFLLKAEKPGKYRESVDINVREARRIIVDLLPVEKGPDGKLRLVDGNVPLLTAGEGERG